MSNDPISTLPVAVGALNGSEQFPGNQAGTTKRITAAQIAALASSVPTAPSLVPITAGGTVDVPDGTIGYSIQATVASTLTINLPAAADRSDLGFFIVDVGGVLFTYNATLVCAGSDTIQGQSTFIMDNNYETAVLYPVTNAAGDYIGWFLLTG